MEEVAGLWEAIQPLVANRAEAPEKTKEQALSLLNQISERYHGWFEDRKKDCSEDDLRDVRFELTLALESLQDFALRNFDALLDVAPLRLTQEDTAIPVAEGVAEPLSNVAYIAPQNPLLDGLCELQCVSMCPHSASRSGAGASPKLQMQVAAVWGQIHDIDSLLRDKATQQAMESLPEAFGDRQLRV